GHIGPFETGKGTHADVIKLCEQKSIDEMTATDCELWIIDCFFRDLESRWSRAQESITASPVEFRLCFLRACDEIRQIKAEQIVALDHVRIPLLDDRSQALERRAFRFLDIFWIDKQQFFATSVIRERNAHDVIAMPGVTDPGYSILE